MTGATTHRRIVLIEPGQFFEFAVDVNDGGPPLIIGKGTSGEVTVNAGERCVVRVECLKPAAKVAA